MNVEVDQRLFGTVPRGEILGLLGPDGPDVDGTRKFLGFTDRELESAARVPGTSGTSLTKLALMPPEVRERLVEIATVCELVASHFGNREKAALWFKTPNPLLGNVSPRDLVR